MNRQTARMFGLCFLLAAMSACSENGTEMIKPSTIDKTESRAFDKPETTYLGQTAASIAADHGGNSGFLLLDRGRDAQSWRLILADAAEKSIDAQYFLWKNDDAGKVNGEQAGLRSGLLANHRRCHWHVELVGGPDDGFG